MDNPASSGGLVPNEADLSGLTEIRVHGVGGTGPDEMLGDRSPVRVSGDRIAGFYRTADAAGRHREAYSWGGLTSHSPLRVFWLLLTPSMLANMAGWTARRRLMNGKLEEDEEPTTVRFRWCARVAALALTLTTALMVTMLSLDTFAYQCLGQQACRGRLIATDILDFFAPYEYPGRRLALGIVAPLAVAGAFYFMASRSRAVYEGIEPPSKAEPGKKSRPVPSRRCAAAQKGGLRSSDFWSGKRWHQHLSLLHLTVGFCVAAGTLGWCVSALADALKLPANGAVWSARVSGGAAVIILVLVVLILAWDEAREGLARGVLTASILALAVAVVAAWTWPVELVGAPPNSAASQPPGVLPGIDLAANVGWLTTVVLLVPLMVQQVWAWASRWRHALDAVPRGPGRFQALKADVRGSLEVFPWAAPVVLHVIALALGNAVSLSLMVLLADALGDVVYGSGPGGEAAQSGPEPGAGGAPVLWVPQAVGAVGSLLSLTLVLVPVLLLAGVAVWLFGASRKTVSDVRSELEEKYAADETGAAAAAQFAVQTTPDSRDKWIYSAIQEDPSAPGRAQFAQLPGRGPSSRWVRRVALMRLVGENAHRIFAWGAIAITAFVLVEAAVFLCLLWVTGQVPMMWVEQGIALGAWLPLLHVIAAQIAFRNEKWRRILMSPFDVGTFFPRSFHPFAPPSYAERAVPELTRRIWWLHDNEGRVVLTAHSQGSVVAAAVVVRQSSRQEAQGKWIGLVTFGCPLGKLYRWAFPALFSDGLLQSVAKGGTGIGRVKWRNVHYLTDYIGGPVRHAGWGTDIPEGTDLELVDPATDKHIFGQRQPRILSHTGYWVDARFWREADRMCQGILLDLSQHGKRPRLVKFPPHSEDGMVSPNGIPARDVELAGIPDFAAPDPTLPKQYRGC